MCHHRKISVKINRGFALANSILIKKIPVKDDFEELLFNSFSLIDAFKPKIQKIMLIFIIFLNGIQIFFVHNKIIKKDVFLKNH